MNLFRRTPPGWRANGLRVEMPLEMQALQAPRTWSAPRYLDLRPYCLPADDQGDSSACAGFAASGLAEERNWRRTSMARTFDGFATYVTAKQLDGNNEPGTSLQQALRAIITLRILPPSSNLRVLTSVKDLDFAMHRTGTILLGFNTTTAWLSVKSDGWIPSRPAAVHGPHAVLGCYYDADGIGFQNSWGGWGCNGFGRLRWPDVEAQFLYGVAVE